MRPAVEAVAIVTACLLCFLAAAAVRVCRERGPTQQVGQEVEKKKKKKKKKGTVERQRERESLEERRAGAAGRWGALHIQRNRCSRWGKRN